MASVDANVAWFKVMCPVDGKIRFALAFIVEPDSCTYLASVDAKLLVISNHAVPLEMNVLPLLDGVGSPLTT